MTRIRGLILLLSLFTADARAEGGPSVIYRWYDDQGRVQFGDPPHPPPGAEAVRPETGYNQIESAAQPRAPDPLPAAHPAPRPAHHSGKSREEQCRQVRERLDRVRSRMRSGYKASQAARLGEQERLYSQQVFKLCP